MPGNSTECRFSPYSPSGNADALDDTDANLSHEHKKEDHEVEGTVAPVGKKDTNKTSKKRVYVCVCVCVGCQQMHLVMSADQLT